MATAIRSRKCNLRSLCKSAARSLACASSKYSAGLIVYNPCEFIGFSEALFLELCIVTARQLWNFISSGEKSKAKKFVRALTEARRCGEIHGKFYVRRGSRVKGRAASDFSVSLWLGVRRVSGVLTEALGHRGLAV